MASTANNLPALAQQPDLRSFIVCERVPDGCTAYPVTNNRLLPLLRAGEWVIVDPTDREPVEDELFVVQWHSDPRQKPQVVEVGMMPLLSAQWGQSVWAVGARHRGHNAKELVFGSRGEIVGDFPYRSEQLTERFLGKVVGILEPSFNEPKRLEMAA